MGWLIGSAVAADLFFMAWLPTTFIIPTLIFTVKAAAIWIALIPRACL